MYETLTSIEIWEEKDSTEVNTNLLNRPTLEQNVIINETKSESVKNECESIGKVWKKNCPNCEEEQTYKTKGNLFYAVKKNRLCQKCVRSSEEYISKMKKLNSGSNNPNFGKHLSEKTKQKISNSLIG